MKLLTTFSLSFLMLFVFHSCSDDFELVDPTEFNQKIKDQEDIVTVEELIQIYYNYPPNEGTPLLTITSRKIEGDLIETTLIHDKQQDDSQRAERIVMTARKKNGKWTVIEIKKSRKCWDGRGHTDWGTEWCN